MTDRYDALTVREDKNGTPRFTKIGAMFANRSGEGFTLMLDAVPASTDGQYRILLSVPKPRDDRERSANADRRQAQGRAQQYDDSDSIPF